MVQRMTTSPYYLVFVLFFSSVLPEATSQKRTTSSSSTTNSFFLLLSIIYTRVPFFATLLCESTYGACSLTIPLSLDLGRVTETLIIKYVRPNSKKPHNA